MTTSLYPRYRRWIVAAWAAAALLSAGCGVLDLPETTTDAPRPSPLIAAATGPGEQSTPGAMLQGGVLIDVRYRYEAARPRTVNGRPVLEHPYWSCVDRLSVTFPVPMRVATVLGKIYIGSIYNAKRAPTLLDHSPDFTRFTYGFQPESLCNDFQQLDRLRLSRDMRSVDGQTLATDLEVKLAYPVGREQPPASQVPAAVVNLPVSWRAATAASACAASDTSRCLTVTPTRLNAALQAMRTWNDTEKAAVIYQSETLQLLPLETLLTPFAAVNRLRHYGNPDLLYVLRRAARLTQLLFPELRAIPVADLSQVDGGTPRVDDVLLHPAGSHEQGRDADVAYITSGGGHDAAAPWHFERNFWFTYGVLQSTGVDLVITAYRDVLKDMAAEAERRGLINSLAVGRFNVLMQDDALNHDRHLHISVRNGANGARSRRFQPSDDVYACYLGLRPEVMGGAFNYCGGT